MERSMPAADVTLVPLAEEDFTELRELAGTIWRQHYTAIISAAQVEFMLESRFSDDALRVQLQAAESWLEVLRASGAPVGYCAYELANLVGDGSQAAGMKLAQLYVRSSQRRQGLGRAMLHHVEHRSRELGREELWLQVNKRNTASIAFYRAAGFDIVREAVLEIGGGFVMDDYLMAKRVAG